MTGLGNFMLAMNAHINRDFPHVIAEVGLTAPDGTSHKPDHNAYNQRLDSPLLAGVRRGGRAVRPDLRRRRLRPVDETGAGVIMRGWREMVWRHAEQLALAKTPAQRTLAQQPDRDVRRAPGRC